MPKQRPIAKTRIDQTELNRIIEALKKRKPEDLPGEIMHRLPPVVTKNQHAAAKMIKSVMAQAGLNVGNIDKMLAEDQKALRADFDKQRAEAASRFPATEKAFRSTMATRLRALKLLGTPFTPSFVTLDMPFLIWQFPHPDNIFINENYESMHSSVRIFVDAKSGSKLAEFVFFYIWENDSDAFAVVNVASSLVVNGSCSANSGLSYFGGNDISLGLVTDLSLRRWSGWGTDSVTGKSLDFTYVWPAQSSQIQDIADIFVEGNFPLLGSFHPNFVKVFQFSQFPLSRDLFLVPDEASVIFEVRLVLDYSMGDESNDGDQVFVDFSNNGNAVFCPNVELEILTPMASTG